MVKQKKPKGKVKGRPRREEGIEEIEEIKEIEEIEEIEELEETLDYMSTEQLVEHMVSLGLNVTEELALELAKREDALFHIRKILQDGMYWRRTGSGDGWTPFHAIHILPLIKTRDALELLLDIMRYNNEDLGDWITEDTPVLLAAFGEDAIAPLKEFASDKTLESFVRGATTTALNVIAHMYPAHQEEILNHFRMLLADTSDAVFGTLLICEILSFGDPSVLDDVYSAFDEGWVDTFLIGTDDVEDMLNDEKQEYMMFMEREPLDHFSKENIGRLMEANPPEEEAA